MDFQNNLQALVDGMSAQWQRERSKTQMTLGKMISRLKELPPESEIEGISEPHSYRGYYSDLSFERTTGKTKVSKALGMCEQAMGRVFIGYKGGEFVMGELTPVWMSAYGSCGTKIISIEDDGKIITEDDEMHF